MTRLAIWVATSGPAGYSQFAPGTVGSVVGILVYLPIANRSVEVQVTFAAVLTLVAVWSAAAAARHFDRSDPSQVVIDEVVGQVVTLIGLGMSWPVLLLGFVTFRVLDIIKPWPANRLEELHGGGGIVADDLMAAVYAQLVLRLSIYLLPGLVA